MDQLIIDGQVPLHGTVSPSGNKNSALPLLAACLLTDEPVVLNNVPEIQDVHSMMALLGSLGATLEAIAPHTWRISTKDIRGNELDPDLCRQIRASILLAGPLLARLGRVRLPPPGGDVIGRRRIDTHLMALTALGAQVQQDRVIDMQSQGLHGAEILLDEASVTATENTIMAAVLAQGETILRNAASEPHVQELCHFLNELGGRIENIGSNVLAIEGVPALHGGEFTLGADYLEVASFIVAAAVTHGAVRIENAQPEYLTMTRLVFGRLGIEWQQQGNDIWVPSDQRLRIQSDLGGAIPEISVMPWPAFPTDMMSIAIVAATQSDGTVLFHDWMYPSRMFFIDKLVSMGARVVLCDPHRALVQGPSQLWGEQLESPDIRAGMALILAALAGRGTSVIRNIAQIDRGYERIDEKMRLLGAAIQRKNP
ncbi:MAG: UDP-N-acetylglucosamine 1-carboxyvinyltransferase [Anaerolineales bacterium]|jgi:UDP-N-acetylglucosamine 1-carboxyvinyltransferase